MGSSRPARGEPTRDVLLKIDQNEDGSARRIVRTSLAAYPDATEPFRTHRAVAGKENGIDIEGLAVRDGILHVGFRGQVLRGNTCRSSAAGSACRLPRSSRCS